MSDFDRSFNRTRKFISIWICFVFGVVICSFIGVGVLTYKGITTMGEQDWSGGAKPVIERLWCGKPGCLGA